MKNNVPSKAQVRGWKISTPTADNSNRTNAKDAEHRDVNPNNILNDTTTLCHGYNLADVDQAARIGVSKGFGWRAGDMEERFAAARLAVIEHLYAADQKPQFHDLINAAQAADHQHVLGEMREHGVNRTERGGGIMPNFERYWWAAGANIPSHEGRIVERIAVDQVMRLLTEPQHQAVTAFAAHGDYEATARALEITTSALYERLRKARAVIATAWHEHETPRREITRDRRVWSRTGTGPDGRKRLTVSDVEHIRARQYGGELVRDMATEAGITPQALHALLRGARRPAPDPAGA